LFEDGGVREQRGLRQVGSPGQERTTERTPAAEPDDPPRAAALRDLRFRL